jgi:methylglutaconyl-CoA hydratase
MALVEVERRGAVAHVWLNRPEQHNALSPELGAALAAGLQALAADEAVRVIVLGGRGRSFCAGADIGAMRASAGATFDDNLIEAGRLGDMFAALAELPQPVVARVHGNVFGGGVGLVCACDVAIATGDAVFALSEVRLGILPALISPYVIRRLGDRAARELMLTGERFGATRALQVGLLNDVVTPEELDAKVEERVLALLQGGPRAQRHIKRLLDQWADSTWEEYRAALPRTLAEVRAGDEAKEGLSAFFEKRKPGWVPGA